MAHTPIPDDHHFVRHVEGIRVERDDNGVIIKVFPEAMALRMLSQPEKDLSGSYLEVFEGDRAEKIKLSCRALKARIGNRFKSLDIVAVMPAGAIRAAGAKRDLPLKVMHEPASGKKDKAAVRGLPIPPAEDREMNAALAAVALLELHEAQVLLIEATQLN